MKDIRHLHTVKSRFWGNKGRPIPGGLVVAKFLQTFTRLNNRTSWLGINIKTVTEFCCKYHHRSVVLVGSNPGEKSPDNSAFHPDTKSRQFVDKWFEGDGWFVVYENLVDFKTEKNKQLSNSQIKNNLDHIVAKMVPYNELGYKIVACGEIASRGLTMAKIDHFKMPHPSGLCRFWNDREASEAKIREMKEWIQNESKTAK